MDAPWCRTTEGEVGSRRCKKDKVYLMSQRLVVLMTPLMTVDVQPDFEKMSGRAPLIPGRAPLIPGRYISW